MSVLPTWLGLLHVLSSRAVTILSFVAGAALALYLIPGLAANGLTGREALGDFVIVFLPYLSVKVFLLLLVTAFDFLAGSDRRNLRRYDVDFEKAKARIYRILYERNVRYYLPAHFVLGVERALLPLAARASQSVAPQKGMPIVLVTPEPFTVIRAHLNQAATKGPDAAPQVEVQIYAEDQKAGVLATVLLSSLQALAVEEALGVRQGERQKSTPG